MQPRFTLYTILPSWELYYGISWALRRQRNISLESLDLNLKPASSRDYSGLVTKSVLGIDIAWVEKAYDYDLSIGNMII